jgi:hypothetical protein
LAASRSLAKLGACPICTPAGARRIRGSFFQHCAHEPQPGLARIHTMPTCRSKVESPTDMRASERSAGQGDSQSGTSATLSPRSRRHRDNVERVKCEALVRADAFWRLQVHIHARCATGTLALYVRQALWQTAADKWREAISSKIALLLPGPHGLPSYQSPEARLRFRLASAASLLASPRDHLPYTNPWFGISHTKVPRHRRRSMKRYREHPPCVIS